MSVFGTRLEDVIQMRRNSLYTAVAENVGRADVWGAEAALIGDLFRHIRVQVAATGLRTEMLSEEQALDGKPLPLRPDLSLYGRLTGYVAWLEGDEAAAFVDVSHRGGYTYDLAALARAPTLVEWGVGGRLAMSTPPALGSHARLGLEARLLNAADSVSADLLGYPRPGRRWAVQISWREDGL